MTGTTQLTALGDGEGTVGDMVIAGDKDMREFFEVDNNGWALLNHGGFGRVSVPVREAQVRHLAHVEEAPNRFFNEERQEANRAVRERLATFLNVEADDLALVPNATHGLNVIGTTALAKGWSSLGTSLDYNGVSAMWEQLVERGARHRVVPIDIRDSDPGWGFESELWAYGTPDLMMVPHIVSATGGLFDVAALSELAAKGDSLVVVDGAHGPGQLNLNIASLGVAAYIGDLHKWACGPRGTAFLWVDPTLKDELVWPVNSVSTIKETSDFGARLNWLGTSDPSAWLSIPDAIEFWESELAQRRYSGLEAGTSQVLGRLGWKMLPSSEEVMMRSYVAPAGVVASELAAALKKARVDVAVIEMDEVVVVRISYAWYVNEDDIERLIAVLEA